MYSYVLQQGVNTDCMHVALANLLFEIIMVRDGVLSLPTWFSRDLIDDVLSSVCVQCCFYCFHCSSALEVFYKWYALYKSTFYLLTYLLTYCMSVCHVICVRFYNTHTHTRLTALFPGLPRWAGTRKVKPIWILLKQETVSGSGISWAICKSAPRSRLITTPAPHHSGFLQAGCPSCRPTNSVKALKAQRFYNK